MVLKLEKIFRVLHRGFGRREITWYSNTIQSTPRAYGGRRVKLHGTQTMLHFDA